MELKKERKSPEILLAEIKNKGINFEAKICVKTIRNYVHKGGILDLKTTDMIYRKVYKEKNKKNILAIKYQQKKAQNLEQQKQKHEKNMDIGKVI